MGEPGFWANALILLIVVAIFVPLLTVVRRRASTARRERWAREERSADPVDSVDSPESGRADAP